MDRIAGQKSAQLRLGYKVGNKDFSEKKTEELV